MMVFATLFNWFYLPQGIALYRSLERTCKSDFVLYVLCIDEYVATVLAELNFSKLRLVHLKEIENDRLKAAQATRTIGEFCWTCTTPLLLHVQDIHGPGSIVSYIDADLCFYSDPEAVIDELGSRSILIHEHDFAPEHADLRRSSGRFNVGLVAVRNDREGRTCLETWRDQCLDECVFDPAAGKCGDQNYLDDWPALYPSLGISANPGIGLAPWNISKYRLESSSSAVIVDGRKVVFYHFHSLRLLRPRFGVKPVVMAGGAYVFSDQIIKLFYQPYARDLWRAVANINRIHEKKGVKRDYEMEFPTLPHEYQKLLNDQLLFCFGERAIPSRYRVQLMEWLYGIDADKSHL